MSSQTYCIVSGVLFSLVAIAHLTRIIYGLSVHVDGYEVSMLFSWIGLIVPGGLAFWAFQLSGKGAATS